MIICRRSLSRVCRVWWRSAMVLLPFLLALRTGMREVRDAQSLIAALAAIATMAVHAAVDFPFYVPVCLLLFGIVLGTADRMLAPEGSTQATLAGTPGAACGDRHWQPCWRWCWFPGCGAGRPPIMRNAGGSPRTGRRRRTGSRWRGASSGATGALSLVCGPVLARAVRAERPSVAAGAGRRGDLPQGCSQNREEPRNQIGRIATHRRFGALLLAPRPVRKSCVAGSTRHSTPGAAQCAGARNEQAAMIDYLGRARWSREMRWRGRNRGADGFSLIELVVAILIAESSPRWRFQTSTRRISTPPGSTSR